jgi:hypothetical protein
MVPKPTYRRIRNFVEHKARVAGFDEVGMWNLVIREITRRHENVAKGKAKSEITLLEAAEKICKAATKERMKMIQEEAEKAAVIRGDTDEGDLGLALASSQ